MKVQLAGCVIENDKGEILLLHRNTPQRQQWETPGGKIEENESPAAAAIREVKEELGIDVKVVLELGRKDFQEDDHDMSYIWYTAKITSGIPKPLEAKHDKVNYFSWNELKVMKDLSPNTKNLVDYHFSQ